MNELTAYTGQEIAAPARDLTPIMLKDFVEWIDRGQKTTATYIINLRQFAAWMKYAGVKQPTRADIVNYREWLISEHDGIMFAPGADAGFVYRTDASGERVKIACKPATVAQYLRSVCQFFKWTAANNLYPDIAAGIHAPKVNRKAHRKEALEAQDVQNIEKSIQEKAQERTEAAGQAEKDTAGRVERSTEQGKRLYAMYELAVTAGLRTVEISRANIKDFETKGGQSWLYVWGKGHTEADTRKALAPEVAEAINDYLNCRKDNKAGTAPLFVATGNRSGGKRLAANTISRMLKEAMKEAGYNSERITAHSLRHTAGTACMELTGDLYTTQQYMRHTNPATTEIYLHNDTEKQEAGIAAQLYGLFHGQQQDHASRVRLENIVKKLNPQQIDKLADIAKALAC